MVLTQTDMTNGNLSALGAKVQRELRNHKGKYIVQGLLFMAAGMLAGIFPATTALNVELILGIIMLAAGVFQLVLTLRSKMHWWSLLSALLFIGAGIVMIWHPLSVLLAFVTLLAIVMTLEGLFEILLAFQFRPVRNWGWMLFSGVVTLLLATILWVGFPVFDVLYLGWVIAINLMLYGLSLLMLVWKVAA